MTFPDTRMRRLRKTPALREMFAETTVSPADLMMPYFVRPGSGITNEISSMPGMYQLSPDTLVEACRQLADTGVRSVMLFGIPEKKDAVGSEGYADNGIVQTAVREIKSALPDLVVCTDVCLCEYTDHGHCGIVKNNDVDNDATIEVLADMALSHARAGADMVAPSDMMDGRVAVIREQLDAADFTDLPIMAYSAKYASSFYGPFRDAAESPPQFGDRRSYQMDIRNAREALTEIELDIEEGADIIMVKPALPYLDIIRAARENFVVPVAAYNVSGEYSMIKAAAEKGWIDERATALESLCSIKRAGADLIITYWAEQAARWMQE